jgi:hypothetical protein
MGLISLTWKTKIKLPIRALTSIAQLVSHSLVIPVVNDALHDVGIGFARNRFEKISGDDPAALAQTGEMRGGFREPRGQVEKDSVEVGYAIEQGAKIDASAGRLARCVNVSVPNTWGNAGSPVPTL